MSRARIGSARGRGARNFELDVLAFPIGRLARHIKETAEKLQKALNNEIPDVLYVPHPGTPIRSSRGVTHRATALREIQRRFMGMKFGRRSRSMTR